MKRITMFAMSALAAAMLAACAPTAENKPANTNTANTNTARPASAPPTKEALAAIEKGAFEAWKNKDGKYFETNLDDKFMMPAGPGKTFGKAEGIKMIVDNKCTVTSYTMSDEKMTPAGADAAVLTTRVTQDVTCEGKKEPAQMTTASVFVRRGDAWKITFHHEVPVKAEDKAASDAKPAAPAGDKMAGMPAAAMKPKAAPANATAANATAANAAPANATAAAGAENPKTGDAATDALMALEREGWEAWKARDAKRLSDWTTSDIAFVDSAGQVFATKDAVIKTWTETACDIKSVTVSDGTSMAVTSDASILISKGTATGTCGGQKVPPLWGMSVYVKQGASWKMAYLMEWEG